jgi:hypothetical protein
MPMVMGWLTVRSARSPVDRADGHGRPDGMMWRAALRSKERTMNDDRE